MAVGEGGEGAGRSEHGGGGIHQLLLKFGAEDRPGQATHDNVGLAQSSFGEQPGQVHSIVLHDFGAGAACA
ncbi:hypothetical protein JOF56_009858 [Kibdelosporangium banguiense]|uniref:Uncharacterized protein n=1 Tax=Kibdelosporangium banguiense TaxID=1365924 RepID=A0ABS4TYJ0_9PSEU|nr:hypothetical protein [Kibdelosporangium banguiense]MBP2329473.1 hypothetical protein [Kibdelosporangium banguiense]